jgi:hypothetical protein
LAEESKDKQTDEQQLRDRFTTDLEIAKKFMDPIHALMDKYYEQYRNRNTADAGIKFKISDLYGYVETVVPILTNSRVRANVKSDYPKYVQHAQGLSDILDHTYDVNNWDYESQEIARMAEIYRSAIAYTGYDGDYRNGSGKICVHGCNIRWCYLDPATSKFDDSSFFFYVEPKRKTEVFKLHPDKKAEIEEAIGKRNSIDKTDSRVRRWFQSFLSGIKNYLAINTTNMTASGSPYYEDLQELDEEEKHKNSIAYIHHWYRDDDDKWRVSYWADEVFLEDRENPFLHGKLPYDIYNPTKDILSSMGVPMGEHIENLNWEKNVLMDAIIKNVKLANNPPAMRNTAYGNIKDKQALTETLGKNGVLDINNPDFVPLNAIFDYLNVPQVSPSAFALKDSFDQMEDRITGVNDSFRGMSDATSGKEVQLKQEAAYTRIKTKIDNYELFNKSIAEKLIVNSMQFYDQNRGFRIKGDYKKYAQNGEIPQDMPFEVQPVQNGMNPDTQAPTYDRSEYYMYANPNEWTKIEEEPAADVVDAVADPNVQQPEKDKASKDDVKQAFRILQMTVEIEAGSSLPTSRMARREEALELFGAQAIDQEALLDSYDWPNRDEVMKRMAEAAKAQQEAEAKAKQAESQQQMEMKRLELEAKTNMQMMGNDAKLQQVNAQVQQQLQGQAPMQGQPQGQPDIASQLDAIRQAAPELAQMSDEQLLQLIARMGQPQGQPQPQM